MSVIVSVIGGVIVLVGFVVAMGKRLMASQPDELIDTLIPKDYPYRWTGTDWSKLAKIGAENRKRVEQAEGRIAWKALERQ